MKRRTSIFPRRRSPLGGLSVLFVDESPDERELFRERFGHECARLASAASVDEALAILDRGETELLVTEIHLPGRDGVELVRRMRELPATMAGAVPAIAAAAWLGFDATNLALASEFAGYVIKPYDTGDLLAVVADVSTAIAALRRLRTRASTHRAAERELRPRLASGATGRAGIHAAGDSGNGHQPRE
jgi:CheY-like chemotaxis protein